MRILLLSRCYPPRINSGVGASVCCLARAIAARQHEVHVLVTAPDEEASDHVEDEVHVHRRPQWNPRWPARRLLGCKDRSSKALTVWRYVRSSSKPFDVIETPESLAHALLPALFGSHPVVACLASPHHILAEHAGTWGGVDAYLADRMEQTLVRRAHAIVVPSRLLAEDLRISGWLGDRSVELCPLAIDEDTWMQVGSAATTARSVLFIGRLERRKAPEVLLRAGGLLKQDFPDLELVFAGRAEEAYADVVRQEAAALGLRCRFDGSVDRPRLRGLLESARVVAVPSQYDSFSMAALEAMCAARPVVCTATTGASELIHQSKGGAVVPPAQPRAMAEALRPYLADAAWAAHAGRAARAIALSRCGSRVIAEAREDLYHMAIDRWRGRRSA